MVMIAVVVTIFMTLTNAPVGMLFEVLASPTTTVINEVMHTVTATTRRVSMILPGAVAAAVNRQMAPAADIENNRKVLQRKPSQKSFISQFGSQKGRQTCLVDASLARQRESMLHGFKAMDSKASASGKLVDVDVEVKSESELLALPDGMKVNMLTQTQDALRKLQTRAFDREVEYEARKSAPEVSTSAEVCKLVSELQLQAQEMWRCRDATKALQFARKWNCAVVVPRESVADEHKLIVNTVIADHDANLKSNIVSIEAEMAKVKAAAEQHLDALQYAGDEIVGMTRLVFQSKT